MFHAICMGRGKTQKSFEQYIAYKILSVIDQQLPTFKMIKEDFFASSLFTIHRHISNYRTTTISSYQHLKLCSPKSTGPFADRILATRLARAKSKFHKTFFSNVPPCVCAIITS